MVADTPGDFSRRTFRRTPHQPGRILPGIADFELHINHRPGLGTVVADRAQLGGDQVEEQSQQQGDEQEGDAYTGHRQQHVCPPGRRAGEIALGLESSLSEHLLIVFADGIVLAMRTDANFAVIC